MEVKYHIIKSKDLKDSHRALFASMLEKQNRVQGDLLSKADRCKIICFAEIESQTVGIGAIKQVTKSDFDSNKANLPELRNEFDWELGYIFVLTDFTGKGIASSIVRKLLEHHGPGNLIATTEVDATPGMVKILQRNGFIQKGNRWNSAITGNDLGLFCKTPIDYFNPKSHKGLLPVRVLQHNILDWFEKLSPELLAFMKDEVRFNNLKPGISYHIDKEPISDVAYISPIRKIHIFENASAFIWCMSYSLFVLFDETIQKPTIEGTFTGKIDRTNPYVNKAIELFNYAMRLRISWEPWPDDLPNPEKVAFEDAEYVDKANSVFISAMSVILTHEFAHQYLGHLDYHPSTKSEFVSDEHKADQFAIDYVLQNSTSAIFESLKTGLVVCFISIMNLSSSLSGGDQHPDNDIRLRTVMEQLNLEDLDNLWGVASLAINLWCHLNKIDLSLSPVIENYKSFFYELIGQLHLSKK